MLMPFLFYLGVRPICFSILYILFILSDFSALTASFRLKPWRGVAAGLRTERHVEDMIVGSDSLAGELLTQDGDALKCHAAHVVL